MHQRKGMTGRSAPAPRPVLRNSSSVKAVGSFLPRLTRPAFEKYGFSAATLITDWETIVGADIATYSAPERLKWPRRVEFDDPSEADRGRPGATLILSVDPGRALDAQYKTQQILERINAYFGYRAVADIRISQSFRTPATPSKPPLLDAPAMPQPRITPPEALAQIEDDRLRAALERMAAGLVSRKLRNLTPA